MFQVATDPKSKVLISWYILIALVELGDRSDIVAQLLIETAEGIMTWCKESDMDSSLTGAFLEIAVSEETVRALSHFTGNSKAKQALIDALHARIFVGRQEVGSPYKYAMYALSALGDPSTREHLEYWTTYGDVDIRRAARLALELFGKATFDEVVAEAAFRHDEKKLSQEIDTLSSKVKSINRDIEYLKERITEKFKEAGQMVYPVLLAQGAPAPVQKIFEQAKHTDNEIACLRQQIYELKAQVPQGGFLSKLKDRAVATGKTLKLELDIHNLNKSRERLILDLGKELYACHAHGISTPDTVQPTWQAIRQLEQQIEEKGKQLAPLKESLEKLQTLLKEQKG
jgi:regulator of replication initiation timing